MLIHCEAEDVARNIDQQEVEAALPKIAAWAETMTRRRGYASGVQGSIRYRRLPAG